MRRVARGAAVQGDDIEIERAFSAAARYLKNRISLFPNLPLESVERLSLGTKLREIGKTEGSTDSRSRAG